MARSRWISFGAQQALSREVQKGAKPITSNPTSSAADVKKFGLENFGNTCYANSVLQALYFCEPFRDLVLQYPDASVSPDLPPIPMPLPSSYSATSKPVRRKPERKPSTPGHATESSSKPPAQLRAHPIPSSPPTLFSALRSLFYHISSQPGDKGSVAPKAFIEKLKELNDIFRSTMHQDAHEFLNYLLNRIVEEMEEERRQSQSAIQTEELAASVATLSSKIPPTLATAASSSSGTHPKDATLVHKLFEGILTSETRCLTCETISSRDESFLDLSIDIEQNSSLTACLRQFSASEMLCNRNKFFCDSCCDLQEAEKRMKIKQLPNVLALHLKRFKYQEDVGKYIKLAYRIAFPMELRLFNTVDDMEDADRLYNLFAIVVHIGNGPHQGHYISIIKISGYWFAFDDDNVYPVPESDIPKYFGDTNSGSAYVLYYQVADIDLPSLGLRSPEPHAAAADTVVAESPTHQTSSTIATQLVGNPPGLEHQKIAFEDVDPSNYLAPTTLPQPRLIPTERPSLAISPVNVTVLPNGVDQTSPATHSVIPSPSNIGFGSKLMNTLRRAPSTSLTRGIMFSNPNGGESRRPEVERSPRPSASSPALGNLDGNTFEALPPVPPLPYNLQASSPASLLQVNGEEKEKPRKEISKTSGGWFTKRKSLKLGERSKTTTENTAPLPPSPGRRIEPEAPTPSSSHWFKNLASSSQRDSQASDSGLLKESDAYHHSNKSNSRTSHPSTAGRNGYDELPSTPGSTSSSLHSTSFGKTTLTSSVRPSTGASTSSSHSVPKHPTILSASTDGNRHPYDRRKSKDSRSSSPSNHNRHKPFPSSSRTIDLERSLPPLPPGASHKHSPSNGHFYVAEPEGMSANGCDDFPHGGTSTMPLSFPEDADSHMRSTTLPPLPLASSAGANMSTGSAPSATSGIRKATRKLSLTAPMLGFGRMKR